MNDKKRFLARIERAEFAHFQLGRHFSYYYEHPGFKKLSIELHAIGYVSEPHYWMKLPRWGPS